MYTVDFETFPIKPLRPEYPPKPVGVSIKHNREPSRYFTGDRMAQELKVVWWSGESVLFHHAAFDLAVAYRHFNLPGLDWARIEDTMILSFLCDPYEPNLKLKPLAAKHCAWDNEDVTLLHQWIMQHADEIGAKHDMKVTKKNVGAFICEVPEEMRKRYAMADTDRTHALWVNRYEQHIKDGLGEAYKREQKLLPILLENTLAGVCVDMERLGEDVETYTLARDLARDWVQRELGTYINLDSADELVGALLSADALIAPPGKNKNGSWKTDKETLHPDQFRRPELPSMLGYYTRLSTCLGTFMGPWLTQAERWNGRISCQWNQTRSASDKGGGVRTGRIGTDNHNLLNISKDFEGRDDGYKHASFMEALPPLPLCRSYILPDPGGVFLHRDFDGQELRLFAHFEQGDLLSKYVADPAIDVHAYIKERVEKLVGREIERTKIKNITFGRLYGAGLPRVQGLMRCGKSEAQQLITAHNGALPGRVMLNEEIVRLAKRGERIRTWGGRLYGMPPSDDGDKSYVLLNYLVQGSAADYTKETLCDWYYNKRGIGQRLLTTVYDEINISAPAADATLAMLDLRDCMNKDRCRTPMLSKGKMGPNWGALASCP